MVVALFDPVGGDCGDANEFFHECLAPLQEAVSAGLFRFLGLVGEDG